MRRKVSTLIDPGLYRRVKLESVRREVQISEIFGEALRHYLKDSERRAAPGVVAETWGVLAASTDEVQQVLEDEDGLFDA